MGTDGRYPKGVLKREQILDTALEVFADEGYRGTSLRTVATRCGLSVAGVLHYFDSREDLLTQVVLRRDQGLPTSPGPRGLGSTEAELPELPELPEPLALLGGLRANTATPGLVELFVSLTAAARDHDHPAHEVLAGRYTAMRERMIEAVRGFQDSGALAAHLDPEGIARLVIAVADGAQLQWMVDDSASLEGPLRTLLVDVLGLEAPD